MLVMRLCSFITICILLLNKLEFLTQVVPFHLLTYNCLYSLYHIKLITGCKIDFQPSPIITRASESLEARKQEEHKSVSNTSKCKK